MGDLPRVTEVLRAVGLGPDFSAVPVATLEHARRRGTALHAAIEWHHEGTLDPASLHPEVRPGFDAYLSFMAQTKHEPIASEVEVIHPVWQYVGHPDRVGWIGADRVLLDFKYTAALDVASVRVQTAAYRMAWNAMHPDQLIMRSFALHLKQDGTYRLQDVTDPAADQIFLAALVVYREIQARA